MLKIMSTMLMLACNTMLAQVKPGMANEMDKLYTPDKNSLFNSAANTLSEQAFGYTAIKNTIKFNPTLLIRSVGAVFYERRLGNNLSAIGGLGICYGKDKVMALGFASELSTIFSETSNVESSIPVEQAALRSKHASAGLFSQFAIRFHDEDYNVDGFNRYYEISARYYVNNLTLDENSSNDYLLADRATTLKSTVFNFVYGSQLISEGSFKTTHDFYFGFGLKTTSYDVFQTKTTIYHDPVTNAQMERRVEEKTGDRESVLSPTIVLGYVFGFGF